MTDPKRMSELIEIEKKYQKSQSTAKRARLKREATIRLKLRRYDEGVKDGKITAVTNAEVTVELRK